MANMMNETVIVNGLPVSVPTSACVMVVTLDIGNAAEKSEMLSHAQRYKKAIEKKCKSISHLSVHREIVSSITSLPSVVVALPPNTPVDLHLVAHGDYEGYIGTEGLHSKVKPKKLAELFESAFADNPKAFFAIRNITIASCDSAVDYLKSKKVISRDRIPTLYSKSFIARFKRYLDKLLSENHICVTGFVGYIGEIPGVKPSKANSLITLDSTDRRYRAEQGRVTLDESGKVVVQPAPKAFLNHAMHRFGFAESLAKACARKKEHRSKSGDTSSFVSDTAASSDTASVALTASTP